MKCLKCHNPLYIIDERKEQYICMTCGAEHNMITMDRNTKNETKYLVTREDGDKLIRQFCELTTK